MTLVFSLLARLPLAFMQALGGLLGWLVWWASPAYRRQFRNQVALSGVDPQRARQAIASTGRMVAELPWVWARPVHEALTDRLSWEGEAHVQKAMEAGKGLIIMSPHLGSWEVGAQALAERFGAQHGAWMVLYRPPRKDWLRRLVAHSRQRNQVQAVPTTLAGVRSLVKALRAGGGTAILPDQVPPAGQGVWAPMWGIPAYTMTLLPRLAQQTGATVLLSWCERLPRGRFMVHVQPWTDPGLSDPKVSPQALAASMNQAVEGLVRAHPEQYLWGYNRHKQPREGE